MWNPSTGEKKLMIAAWRMFVAADVHIVVAVVHVCPTFPRLHRNVAVLPWLLLDDERALMTVFVSPEPMPWRAVPILSAHTVGYQRTFSAMAENYYSRTSVDARIAIAIAIERIAVVVVDDRQSSQDPSACSIRWEILFRPFAALAAYYQLYQHHT